MRRKHPAMMRVDPLFKRRIKIEAAMNGKSILAYTKEIAHKKDEKKKREYEFSIF